jgi:hypothetical protein
MFLAFFTTGHRYRLGYFIGYRLGRKDQGEEDEQKK